MDDTKNTKTTKECCKQIQNEETTDEKQAQFSFSIDNSLEEIYITNINLGKDEKNDSEKETKNTAQKEAETIKELFLLY